MKNKTENLINGMALSLLTEDSSLALLSGQDGTCAELRVTDGASYITPLNDASLFPLPEDGLPSWLKGSLPLLDSADSAPSSLLRKRYLSLGQGAAHAPVDVESLLKLPIYWINATDIVDDDECSGETDDDEYGVTLPATQRLRLKRRRLMLEEEMRTHTYYAFRQAQNSAEDATNNVSNISLAQWQADFFLVIEGLDGALWLWESEAAYPLVRMSDSFSRAITGKSLKAKLEDVKWPTK